MFNVVTKSYISGIAVVSPTVHTAKNSTWLGALAVPKWRKDLPGVETGDKRPTCIYKKGRQGSLSI